MKQAAAILSVVLAVQAAWAEPFTAPPAGYALVAEDDCGEADAQPHVVRGKSWFYPAGMIEGDASARSLIFDDSHLILRYPRLDPKARYKVDLVYVTEGQGNRRQTLHANGAEVHGEMTLPYRKPGRFLFDIPPAACAKGGPLELKFTRTGLSNCTVCVVRIWSTDPRGLGDAGVWLPSDPIEADWRRQAKLAGRPAFAEWDDGRAEVEKNVLPCVNEQFERGRSILRDLRRLDAAGLDAPAGELARAAARRDELRKAGNFDPREWLAVYLSARRAVRRLVFCHPALAGRELLFVRRHHPHAYHQCSRRLGIFTLPGGAICTLGPLAADALPTPRPLTEGKFPAGTFTRPDLSFDGRRIVFGFAPERSGKDKDKQYGHISQNTADLFATHQVGPCHEFQIYEMDLDGASRPCQLTRGPCENADPIYLPGGRIAYMSHAPGGRVQCGDWALAYCVFTMEADGSSVRQITMSKDGEWDPFLLDDGTIGFTRWEYVMKFWSPIQMIWSVRPDGTNPRMIYGSDLSRKYAYPLNYAFARQVPGTSKLVCIGSAHHNTGAGPVCMIDLAMGPNVAEGLTRLTPVRYVETGDKQPDAGWYDNPYPLDERYFLVSYSFSAREDDTRSYGLYLLDAYGGKELIYRDAELSALFPMVMGPRRRPGTIATLAERSEPAPPRPKAPAGSAGWSELLIQDVHQGLPPELAGKAKFVQVVEVHERHIHTRPYDVQVGPDSGFEVKTVLGTVPVEADGSAYFRLPADASVFFSVLDEDCRALHTMRSATNLQAAERTACVGCHEPFRRAPSNAAPLAGRRPPSEIAPPPWGVRRMDYAALIQPMLDKRCAACHDGNKEKDKGKGLDLTARAHKPFHGMNIPLSYYNLRRHVKHAPIFAYSLPPGSFGSRVSPLIDRLRDPARPCGLKVPVEDVKLLQAWIDCNAPFMGRYEQVAAGK